jgi:hypothetical protein
MRRRGEAFLCIRITRAVTHVLFGALYLYTSAAPLAANPGHHLYLTRAAVQGIPGDKPQVEFSCDDTIYAVAEFSGLANGKHELLANWSDPRGKTRERTPLAFHVRQPRERVWVWLRLNRPSGSAAISFFDPAAGMSEFIGQWTVVLTLDGARLDTLRFKVLC